MRILTEYNIVSIVQKILCSVCYVHVYANN